MAAPSRQGGVPTPLDPHIRPVVGPAGFEPATSASQRRRATSCAKARRERVPQGPDGRYTLPVGDTILRLVDPSARRGSVLDPDRVREGIRARGFEDAEFAKVAGIDRQTLTAWLRGARRIQVAKELRVMRALRQYPVVIGDDLMDVPLPPPALKVLPDQATVSAAARERELLRRELAGPTASETAAYLGALVSVHPFTALTGYGYVVSASGPTRRPSYGEWTDDGITHHLHFPGSTLTCDEHAPDGFDDGPLGKLARLAGEQRPACWTLHHRIGQLRLGPAFVRRGFTA